MSDKTGQEPILNTVEDEIIGQEPELSGARAKLEQEPPQQMALWIVRPSHSNPCKMCENLDTHSHISEWPTATPP